MACKAAFVAFALVAMFAAIGCQAARELHAAKNIKLPDGVGVEEIVATLTAFRSAADDLTSVLPGGTGLLATVLNLVSGIVGQVLSLLTSLPGGLGSLPSLPGTTALDSLPGSLDLGAVTGGLPGGLPVDLGNLNLGSLLGAGGIGALVQSLTSKIPPVGGIGGTTPGVGGLAAVPLVGPLLAGLLSGLLGQVPLIG